MKRICSDSEIYKDDQILFSQRYHWKQHTILRNNEPKFKAKIF
jgi:hypothetical protein